MMVRVSPSPLLKVEGKQALQFDVNQYTSYAEAFLIISDAIRT